MAIIAREKREAARRAAAERAHEKASRKKAAVNPLQALWDANGAAIYAANQAFKTKYGKNMSAKVRRKAIKDATRNGHFNAGAYAGNLVKAVTPPPPKKEDPYAGIGDWVERQDKSNAKMLDETPELEKWAALQKQKNAPVDSATASYMAMGAAVEAGKFSKEDYDKAREQGSDNFAQADLTGWLPLVMRRNATSLELSTMRNANKISQEELELSRSDNPFERYGATQIFMANGISGGATWMSETLTTFKTLNTGEGKWDIKIPMKKRFRSGGPDDAAITLCSNSGECRWVDYSTPCNILYGYTAASVGVPRWLSKLAGGLLEFREGTAKKENLYNLLEDPYDTVAVEFGYDLFDQHGDDILENEFREDLTDNVLEALQPPPEGFQEPGTPIAQNNQYSADEFDYDGEEK